MKQKHIVTGFCNYIYRNYNQTFSSKAMDMQKIFHQAVSSVNPENLIRNSVKLVENTQRGRHVVVHGTEFEVLNGIYLVGFGKAVQAMALTMEKILGSNIAEGIVTIPAGSKLNQLSKIRFIEGAKNNLPDLNSMAGAIAIKDLITCLQKDDLLIVLISGGGSALLPLPKPGIVLEEKISLIKELSNAGANITELNTVRKKLSVLKGGGLAKLAYPCQVVSLILSDVIGDPLDFIASGPTYPNTDDDSAAKRVLDKYNLLQKQPKVIRRILDEVNSASSKLDHVSNFIIGSNKLATQAARVEAIKYGYQHPVILSHEINGDVRDVALLYMELCKHVARLMNREHDLQELREFIRNNFGLNELEQEVEYIEQDRFCFISGGETTVVVNGDGRGGRNQQLALEFASLMHRHQDDFRRTGVDIQFLSAGTDGFDGPTDAAGALVDTRELIRLAIEQGLDPDDALRKNNSYEFFSNYKDGECLIRTGHTGTNVMDLHILTIHKI